MKINIFWFRRDLRLEDNTGLYYALKSALPLLPIFIFDNNILKNLPEDDARVSFIYNALNSMNKQLQNKGTSLIILQGDPVKVWEKLLSEYEVIKVYWNKDYEPYALERDKKIRELLDKRGIELHTFKDQVVFEENEIIKNDGKPYTVYTPYKKKWLEQFILNFDGLLSQLNLDNFYKYNFKHSCIHF